MNTFLLFLCIFLASFILGYAYAMWKGKK